MVEKDVEPEGNTSKTRGADTTEFRRLEKENMRLSKDYEKSAQRILWFLGAELLLVFGIILYLEKDPSNSLQLFIWLLVVMVISSPLFLIYWARQNRRYECLTLAYGFQRKAIVEERLFSYAGENKQLLDELLKIYLIHWMEKSPLEVMLAMGGKGKNISTSTHTAAKEGKATDKNPGY